MEEYIAIGFVLLFLFGYVGVSIGVGMYASKYGRSFLFYFLLALFINPVPIFILVLVLNTITVNTQAAPAQAEVQHDRESASSFDRSDAGEGRSEEAFSSGEGSFSTEGAAPRGEPDVEEEAFSSGTVEEDEREARGQEPEGKVRCDTCYSLVDESESECPACGSDLGTSGGFF